MTITKRCIRCLKPLDEKGNCINPKCSRYKAPEPEATTTETKEEAKEETN